MTNPKPQAGEPSIDELTMPLIGKVPFGVRYAIESRLRAQQSLLETQQKVFAKENAELRARIKELES